MKRDGKIKRMRLALVLAVALLSAFLCLHAQCRKELINTWQFSSEESTNENEVYRPISYALPPARGRRLLTFREDGSFTQTSIGRDDRRPEQSGRWSLVSNRQLVLATQDAGVVERTIVRCGPQELVLKRPR